MFGHEMMKAFGELKAALDPGNKLNPHKVVDAYLPTDNLRLGAGYKPLEPKTHFKFPDDGGSFFQDTLRWLGPRACPERGDDAPCPGDMEKGGEEHSTRGRAHI